MPQTPIPAGSILFIGVTDTNDPDSPLEVSLVKPNDDFTDNIWENLGNSFGSDSRQLFLWMVRGCAAFHRLEVQLEEGLEIES